jgi:hypothetical protein
MLDGSAILKPALARGTLRCLGCSSPDKFKKTIEKDPGLERRFQQVGFDQQFDQIFDWSRFDHVLTMLAGTSCSNSCTSEAT